MSDSLVADLRIGPQTWLFLSLLGCLVLFFKFGRLWSLRNLDLLLLFAPAPGLVWLVGAEGTGSGWAYVWLLGAALLWFLRCLLDVGLRRRPLLEPNLNAGGLGLLAGGLLGLIVMETATLPEAVGIDRNPAASPTELTDSASSASNAATVGSKVSSSTRALLRTLLAIASHLGIAAGLFVVGWRHFQRPLTGLAMATCAMVMPYTRLAILDVGQLVPAALFVAAVVVQDRPRLAAVALGVAAAWCPAMLGLLPVWASYYRGRGARRFLAVAIGVALLTGGLLSLGRLSPAWPSLGVRTPVDAGIWPGEGREIGRGLWAWIEPSYRYPVLIAYVAMLGLWAIWPREKDLANLLSISAAVLVASQFWLLNEGGALILIELPAFLLMVFRPNLAGRRAPANPSARKARLPDASMPSASTAMPSGLVRSASARHNQGRIHPVTIPGTS